MAGDVEEVKQKTDIVSIISEHVELKKAGRNYKATCPFHSEKTPSFMVSPELQIFKCFGCGESGDAISFLEKYEGMDFYEALKFLADRAGVKLKPGRFQDKGDKQRLYELNSFASRFYQYILLKHQAGKSALRYLLKDRGLSKKAIEIFQLGYAPEVIGAIGKFLIDKKRYKKFDLEKAGICYFKGPTLIDRFAGRVIFPLHDHRGNVAGFAGRVMPGRSKDRAKYINTPETPIYHKSKMLYGLNLTRADIKKKKEAIVVEGQLDAISSWQIGITNIVAVVGTALTSDQAILLSRFAERAILALDEDIAGDAAARRGINVAEDAGLEVRVARMKGFKDPDEMARKAPDKLKKSFKDTVNVWDFVVDSVFSKHDEKTGTGKSRISKEIIPIISSINDEIVQAHYAEVVAKRLEVPTSAVAGQISQIDAQGADKKTDKKIYSKAKKERRDLLEERLMSLAISIDPKILLERQTKKLISTSLYKRILDEFEIFSKKKKKFDPSVFSEGLPKELVNGFAEMILGDSAFQGSSLSDQKKELELVKKELKILEVKEKLESITKKIKDLEKRKEKGKLKQAERKFSKLTQTLSALEEIDRRGIIL